MAVEKIRVGLTLTRPYLDALDRLVEVGIYLERQDAIRAALRLLLKEHGIPLAPEEGSGW